MLKDNKKIFYHLLANTMVSSVTTTFIWFALTFWVYLSTKSVLVTSLIAGIFAVSHMSSAFVFGNIVDRNKKHTAMVISNVLTLIGFGIGAVIFFSNSLETFANPYSPALWALIVSLMLGSVAGNLRMIALSTLVTQLFDQNRDKANGMIGAVNGISFSITAALSGLVIGFYSMQVAIVAAIIATTASLIHLLLIHFGESPVVRDKNSKENHFSFKETIKVIVAIPGLFGLIFFTTFNNFLGGVFMALMDAYGLSLVSVQTWGLMFAVISFGFIAGSTFIAKFGLGKNPLRTMLLVNVITWTTCIFFTIQPSVILLGIGMLIWMTLGPFVEASEQTVIQNVVPFERQGRVFGFAQSVESAATPITALLIGPIAQFIFIPFMTTGRGVNLIGSWFGTGQARGIALVFTIAGAVGLIVTILALRSKSYKILSKTYLDKMNIKKELTPEQKRIMIEKGTEAPFSGNLITPGEDGVYRCAACDNPLFNSDAKFESGTGWPSFDQAIPGAVKNIEDNTGGMQRIEVVCAKCNSHLGHVFDDGPTETGKRYCINSVCLE